MIQGVYVQRDVNIPTHSAAGVFIGRNAMRESRAFARTLPSLKTLYDDKVAERCKEIEDEKVRTNQANNIKEEIHDPMDKKILEKRMVLNELKEAGGHGELSEDVVQSGGRSMATVCNMRRNKIKESHERKRRS